VTAPRIIPADEAQALLEAATPGPWMHNWRGPEDGAPGDLWHTGGCGGPLTREADWVLAANAPDLAASVVALHAEVEALQVERHHLGELLAVIHRDGGHHTARVGLEASLRDAHDRVIRERVALYDALAERQTEQPDRWRSPIVQHAHDEADHDYREVLYDRDDYPVPPTCAHCGRARVYCRGRKP